MVFAAMKRLLVILGHCEELSGEDTVFVGEMGKHFQRRMCRFGWTFRVQRVVFVRFSYALPVNPNPLPTKIGKYTSMATAAIP